MKEHIEYLKSLNACKGAVEYADKFETLQQAWDKCERGDWMLWLIGKQSGEPGSEKRKKLVPAACKCARLSLKYIPKDEKRPLKAIQTAEKWAMGKAGVSIEDVRDAADAAYAAAAAAADAAASYAAAAADAAAAYAADTAAAYAAYAAAYAADAYAAARNNTLKECADIVRKFYPKVEISHER